MFKKICGLMALSFLLCAPTATVPRADRLRDVQQEQLELSAQPVTLEGCTPGFWKQPQHFDSWVAYSPGDLFDTVFGITAFPGKTLLQVLEQGGGEGNALGRHAVAALLNAAHPAVNYFYSEAEVITIVQNAFASGDFESAKDLLEVQNEKGCPLNGDGECDDDDDCDDGDPCTVDFCDPATGQCVNAPIDCDDNNPCTDDFCDPVTGACVHVLIPGATCATDADCLPNEQCIDCQCVPSVCPIADYGDAPDDTHAPGAPNACEGTPACVSVGKYPTVCNTLNAAAGRQEPTHATPFNVWLGPHPNTETTEPDADQPCCDWITGLFAPPPPPCDEDDGPIVLCLGVTPAAALACASGVFVTPGGSCLEIAASCFGPNPCVPAAPCFGVWIFEVSLDAGAPALPRFANVVVDWGLTGVYGDAALEWALVDDPVAAAPGGTEIKFTLPFPVLTIVKNPLYPLGWGIDPFWTRFLVSPEAISPAFPGGDWDGSGALGGYPEGETEDWVVICDPDVPAGKFADCNENGIPDPLDILLGNSQDVDGNGIPDECLPGCCIDLNGDGNPECLSQGDPQFEFCLEHGIQVPTCQGDNDGNGIDNACQPPPTGACCLDPDCTECIDTTEEECTQIFGGLWLGPGIQCPP